MASISERQACLERVRASYHVWALVLLLCPLSYVSLTLIRYLPITGVLVTILVGLFVLTFALTTRDGRTESSLWHGTVVAVVMGVLVWAVAAYYEEADSSAATVAAVALVGQLGFFWIFYAWVTLELAGASVELGDATRPAGHTPARPSLSFLLFVCLLLFGLGTAWSHGDSRTPDPALWVIAQSLLALGVMFLERLGFCERSACEGNLAFTRHSHRVWVAGAVLLVLLASTLALLGPRRTAAEQPSSHSGNVTSDQQANPISAGSLEQGLREAAAAVAAGAQGAPRRNLLLWLLLLLLLLLVWVASRTRLGRWLRAAAAWLLARARRLWERLLAFLRRLVPPATPRTEETAEPPPWVQDPLLDIFDHPDLLAQLSPRELAIRVFHLLMNVGDMLGQGRRHEQTPLEYSRSLRLDGEARAALQELTWSYAAAMYGTRETALPTVEALRSAWQQVAAALTAPLSPEDLAARQEAYRRRPALSPRPT